METKEQNIYKNRQTDRELKYEYEMNNSKQWELSDISHFLGTDLLNHKGEGLFSVAIIDTGIYPNERFSGNRDKILYFEDMLYEHELPYDDNGHGTAIADIILSDKGGMAPFVNVVALKVLNYKNEGRVEDIIKALQWVIQNREEYNIRIINLSIRIDECDSDTTEKLLAACETLNQEGVLLVVAGGNYFEGNGLGSQIRLPGAVYVGSVEFDEGKNDFSLSSYTDCYKIEGEVLPEICTLGSNILVAKSNGLYKGLSEEKMILTDEVQCLSGTSLSAAIVTGYICNLLSENEGMSNEEIRDYIIGLDRNVYCEKYNCYIPVLGGN